MPVTEQTDTKQQIIERLNAVPPEKLRNVLEYVEFISLDEEHKEWLREPAHLTDRERELIQEALDDPRPDLADSEVDKILGM
jgi:hypothetical protein